MKLKKGIIWKWASLVSRWHVFVDRLARKLLVKIDKIQHDNLRLWIKNITKILIRYYNEETHDED